ncbi:MFS transporter [Rhizobium sp. L1K21]|uniref:MFS transporter n=1 Tax=Rhizobium sp. L1K21 TaxID=2954933 RepID=UPI002092557F|nr:MFS transporter [Rhizobium sp. L1K21]MCO6188027.1 MFS transporter [Rhizobium sp. L1K21]
MMFDWAAQPTFTVVTTFIFGPYFVSRLTDDPVAAQTMWSNMATLAGIMIAVFSPILGSIADATGRKKPWIGFFSIFLVIGLSLLWYAVPGSNPLYPFLLMVMVTVSVEFSTVFNDSMMPTLVSKDKVGKISNIAWGLGYTGGMIVLIGVVALLAASPDSGKTILGIPALFGLDPATGDDARVVGPLSAVWYVIFVLPMFLFTPDARSAGQALVPAVRQGFAELGNTLKQLRQRKSLLRFLIARMIYQDGVNGLLVLGGAFAAGLFGWVTMEIGIYGIILNLVAIPSCIVAGYVDSIFGSKRTIILSLFALLISSVGIVSTSHDAALFGLVQLSTVDQGGLFGTAAEKLYIFFSLFTGLAFGPIQASSRSYLSRSIEPEEAGRYFGIYALTGRITSFMATAAFSIATAISGSAYWGMATISLFFVAGLVLLWGNAYPALPEKESK